MCGGVSPKLEAGFLRNTCVLFPIEVEEFNDADSAWQAIQSNPEGCDVAISDYTMPGKTGIGLARDIHSLNAGIPILLATGLLDKLKIDRPESPNVVEIMTKPFNAEVLVSAISRSL